ncbi:sulfatase-like hydrolase/transferase [candidate division KSB1 bacterium]|nr:sulfatase-like hydrolase/transferase [candidate division KSB1 bacterium]
MRKELGRRDFIKLLSYSSATLLFQGTTSCAPREKKPNIVLIMVDDFGYENLGCHGGTSYKTPNIDKLAQTGIRFEHCYSAPVCTPSRVKLLTGRYSFRTGQGWGHIPSNEITIASILQNAGYATAISGKWQLNLLKENPQYVFEKGFDEYCCWGWHEGPRYWNPLIYQNGKILDGIHNKYGPDVCCDFIMDFIARNKNKPFFAYYAMNLTHFPKKKGPYVEPKGPSGHYQTYSEMVEKADDLIGRIVRKLDNLNLCRNTIIIFTGDNGTPKTVTSEMGGRKIKGGKGKLTDAGTHVPLIVNWSGNTPTGVVCNDLVDFSDFFPTLAEIGNADIPQHVKIDGKSFAPQIQGKKGQPREWAHTEWKGKAWIRTQDWKLYRDGKLYDMKNDPLENYPIFTKSDSDNSAVMRKKLLMALERLDSTK